MGTGDREHFPTPRRPLVRYGATVGAVALAALARWLLDPLLGDHAPYVTFYAAVAFGAWLGGLRTGLLATLLGGGIALLLLVPPRYSFALTSAPHLVGFLLYLAVGATVSGFGEALWAAWRREAENRERLRITLASIGDGVITTDPAGRVVGLNPVAERLTGWSSAEAAGRPLDAVFRVVHETTRQAVDNPAARAVTDGAVVALAGPAVLIARDGTERAVEDSAGPIRTGSGEVVGSVLVFRDVTDRRRAEQRERDGRELTRLVADAVPALISYVDADGRYRLNNRAYETWFGRPREELLGRHVREVLGEVAWEVVRPRIESALAGVTSACELEVPDRSGGTRWVAATYAPDVGPDGRVRGLVAHVHDVTARRQTEEALRRQTDTLRAVTDTTTDLIFLKDTDCRITFANPACLAVLGRTEAEVVGVDPAGLYRDPVEAAAIHANDRRIMASGRSETVEEPFTGPLGPRIFVATKTPLRDGTGAVVGLVGISQDVTEQKRAADALRDSEARYRMATEAVAGLVYDLDLTTGRVERSVGLEALVGFRPDEAEPTGPWWSDRVHPDDLARVQEEFRVSTAAGATTQDAEYRVRHRDGTYRHVWDRSVLMRDETGRIVRAVGCTLDVTARRQAEEEARRRAEEFRVLLDTLPISVFVAHDPDCRAITGNRAAQDLLRTPAWNLSLSAPADEQPAHFRVCRNGVELPADRLPVQRAARGEVVVNEEMDIVFDDGRVVSELISAAPLYDADGRVRGAVGGALDITARRQVEAELQRTAATLNGLIASAPVGIVLLDADMRYRHINGPLAEMNGLPVEAHLGKTVAEVVPDLHEEVATMFRRVMRDAEIISDFVLEGETPKAPGVKRAWRESWFPVLGPDGRPDGVGVIVQEITEQLRVERERENGRRTLAELVEQCPFGIYIVDSDFRIASMNAGSREKAFANVRPVVGRPFDEAMRILWPEPVAAEVVRIFRHTLDTGEPYRSADFVNPRADTGTVEGYEWELHRIVLPDGRHGVVCYYFDATPLRRAEAALRDSEAHFRSMADHAPAMLWVTDPAGSCTYISRQWCEFTGTTADQNLGLGWLACVHPDDLPPTEASFLAANDGRQPFRIDYRLRRHDGEYRWAVDAGLPRFDGGAFVGYVGCVFDVHDRRLGEERLRDADRRKDEFLATLAHELRNPLAPLRTGLQVLKLAGGSEAVQQTRAMMDRQLTQMVRLVNDLLDVSRITLGKLELRRERTDLRAVIAAAVETAGPQVEAAGHAFAVAVPDDPVPVDGDPTRLAQVVANLLTNAAKYTPRGGHVRLAVRLEEGTAVVTVTDDGIGIPPAMLGRVFEMFTQVDRTLERTTGGLGLGLSLVKRLVEMHGGTVEARSGGEGAGSEFVVRLPVLAAPPAAPPAPTAEEGAGAGRRVLVVDDNADAADSLGQLLTLLGNDVRTAPDGEDGVRTAEAFRPDLVLMDIGMPKLNGYDAARLIRAEPWGQRMVLVALTGWGLDDGRAKSAAAGFDHHLVKPVDPAELSRLLTDAPAGSSVRS